jgi:AcrR family transcriptional regulator
MPETIATKQRKRRSDGERSRSAILHAAAELATTEGIEGLSIGRLADHVGMSKSGVYAHFRSKEELQLATIDVAQAVFGDEVVTPAMSSDDAFERLEALCEQFLSHVERSVFPGGCFFASVAAEMDTRPGPVKDRAAEMVSGWLRLLRRQAEEARDVGAISADEDPAQLAFELNALLSLGNQMYVLRGEPEPMDRARRGLSRRLALARA